MKRIATFVVALAALIVSGRAWSIDAMRLEQITGGSNVRESASLFWMDIPNSNNYPQAGELYALRVMPLGGSTASATIAYFSASANTQVALVLPRNASNVEVRLSLGTAAGPSSTNYARVSWSSSTTGSAPTGGTEEAYYHFKSVYRDTPGQWTGLVLGQTGGTLYLTVGGGQTPAQSGCNGISVSYVTP